jgi:hypothetical protein
MKFATLKIFVLIIVMGLLPWPVFGAGVHFNPTSIPAQQSQPSTVTLLIDTQQDSINAIDGVVLVAKELGDSIVVSDSGSIITYWIEQPTWDPGERTIKFSGAIPGGYNGNNAILFSVIVSEYDGPAVSNALTATNLHSYANDGAGTPIMISSKQFAIGGTPGKTDGAVTEQLYIGDSKQDSIPPETFSPHVTRDERVFDNKWFVNFATIDKQSGIDHYEVQESRNGRINSGNWKTASSPYLLEDQNLQSFIFITAIDRQGNERVIKVFPKNELPWFARYWKDIMILVVIVLIVGVSYWYYKREHSKLKSANPAV